MYKFFTFDYAEVGATSRMTFPRRMIIIFVSNHVADQGFGGAQYYSKKKKKTRLFIADERLKWHAEYLVPEKFCTYYTHTLSRDWDGNSTPRFYNKRKRRT